MLLTVSQPTEICDESEIFGNYYFHIGIYESDAIIEVMQGWSKSFV